MPDDTRSEQTFQHWYAYQGPLGEVVCNGRYFFAWKDGFLIGTYNTLEEAMESSACREWLKTHEAYTE